MSRVYASLRHPLYYAITVLLGACLALICCGDVAFQALYAAAHFAVSVAVTRAARADLGEQRAIWLVWATAVVGANAAVYGLSKDHNIAVNDEALETLNEQAVVAFFLGVRGGADGRPTRATVAKGDHSE